MLNRYDVLSHQILRQLRAVVAFLSLFYAALTLAQHVVATTDLNVRMKPTTRAHVLTHLLEGDTVSLLATSPRRGYYHIQMGNGVNGWAWTARLQLVDERTTPDALRSVTSPSPSSAGNDTPANAFDTAWTHRPSNAASYRWTEGNAAKCSAVGVGGDSATNRWKNRDDTPAAYSAVTWDVIARLGFPHNTLKHRSDWPAADKTALARYAGVPVSVIGFLSGISVQLPRKRNGLQQTGESANCGQFTPARVDWHIHPPQHQRRLRRRCVLRPGIVTRRTQLPAHPS